MLTTVESSKKLTDGGRVATVCCRGYPAAACARLNRPLGVFSAWALRVVESGGGRSRRGCGASAHL